MIYVILFTIVPLALTALNIKSLVKRGEHTKLFTDITVILGTLFVLLEMLYVCDLKWNVPVKLGVGGVMFHQPFSEDYSHTLFLTFIWSSVSLFKLNREKLRPPLAAAIFVSGIYAGMALFIAGAAQMFIYVNDEAVFLIIFLVVYVLNFFLCSVRVIRDTARLYTEHFKEHEMDKGEGFRPWLCRTLSKISGWIWFPLLCLIPFTGLLVCICIVLGQGPFGMIKAFTETSDWRFSQMVSPPPIEHEGHYLCTVAVNGHEKVVKPTRLGVRHGEKIGVNRQLCAANAFEQLIEDKAPRFHRFVRHIYDTYGYPVSKHITTKFRADAVYIIMKPLEWLFVLCLYLFDNDPESRIAVQYTGRHVREFYKKG